MKIAVVGNLCQQGYLITKNLRLIGYEADLFITKKGKTIIPTQNPENYERIDDKTWIKDFDTSSFLKIFFQGIKIMPEYDGIIALTLSPSYIQFFTKNLVSIATGSDIREFAFQKGIQQSLLRLAYKNSKKVFTGASDIKYGNKLGIKEKMSLTLVPLNFEKYNEAISYHPKPNNRFKIFAPANWDKIKGIEKLISSCDSLSKDGYDFSLVMIDNRKNEYSDKNLIKIISDFDINNPGKLELIKYIESKNELLKLYRESNIIADQFNIGFYGNIGCEAMACQRPLLCFFDNSLAQYFHNEIPPILNAKTAEEIKKVLERILKMNEEEQKEYLLELGNKSRTWEEKYYDSKKIAQNIADALL
jgi:hypothetical protein